jgi:glutathione S-transferase
MLELVTLPPAFGMRNISPFCLKSEMLMTSLEIPFKMTQEADPRQAPNGKLPFLVVDGKRLPDSELMAVYLDDITQGIVYGGLTPAQNGQGLALARLAEDHLYWLMVASRWLDDAWWPNIVEGFFGIAPRLVRPLVAAMARREVSKGYRLHGLGRHSLEDQKAFALRDLAALEGAVPELGFLFGDSPGIYDFTIAALMAGIFDNQPATWLTTLAMPFARLHAYTERVQAAVGVYGRPV